MSNSSRCLYKPIHTLSSFTSQSILLLQHLIGCCSHVRTCSMKRQIQTQNTESLDLAISLMLLSQPPPQQHKSSSLPREFECKTCNRKFSSFQALGGHRASHKKPKLDDSQLELQKPHSQKSLHECSICGQRFSLGQALGGHMRKHRAAMNEASPSINEVVSSADVPVLKRSSSSKRVMSLDLNLTPLENDLKLLFGNKAPSVNLSLC